MKPFVVRLYSESSIKLNKPFEFRANRNVIRVHDLLCENRPASGQASGPWEYTVHLSAEDAPAALREAEAYIKYIADFLSFTEGAAIDNPQPLVAIDIDESSNDRSFAQPLYADLSEMRSRRPLSGVRMRALYALVSDKPKEKLRARVERSLHLYRKALAETDPLDRFQDLWAALEALNPLLREKYSAHRKYPQPCPKCHEPLTCGNCDQDVELVDSSSGIRYLFCDLLNAEEDWSDLRRTRVEIVHSLDHPLTIGSTLAEKAEKLRVAVVKGILALVDYTDTAEAFLDPPLRLASAPRMMLVGTIHDMPPSVVTGMLPSLPHFAAEHRWDSDTQAEPVSGGFLRSSSISIKPQGFQNKYSFMLQITGRRGPRDDGLFDASMEFSGA